MKKTKFDSYCLKDFAVWENKKFSARQKSEGFLSVCKGCKYCVQGKKLVLFVSGKCSRTCKYCSLSNKRKNIDKTWANERECKNISEILEEAKESHAFGAGITGGDPLLCLGKTLKFVKALKKKFGKKFHIHIYLPTNLVTLDKLRKLSRYIDEVRFHPKLLGNEKIIEGELEKISLAGKFWKRENIGIEIPMFPEKVQETFYFIKSVSELVGFVNLNELEISDTNFNFIKLRYKLNNDTYTIKNSREAGLEILKRCEKERLGLKVHLCTARTKNLFQYKNRIKLRDILPFGFRTKEGSVRYFAIYLKNKEELDRFRKHIVGMEFYFDKKKNRIILSEKSGRRAFLLGYVVERVEELPTFDAIELEREII